MKIVKKGRGRGCHCVLMNSSKMGSEKKMLGLKEQSALTQHFIFVCISKYNTIIWYIKYIYIYYSVTVILNPESIYVCHGCIF